MKQSMERGKMAQGYVRRLLKKGARRWAIALAALLLGTGTLLIQQRWLLAVATQIRPGALYAVTLPPEVPPMVALTIDDGPSVATDEILEVLEEYGAKATFFNISGNVEGHETAVARIVTDGHELGNHLTTDEASAKLSSTAFESDLLAAESVWLPYLKDGDDALTWLRPGMGWYTASMVETAQRHGYQLVLGSVFPYDTHMPFPGFASAFILSRIEPGDVIVLHDGADEEGDGNGRGDRAVKTLEKILPSLQEKGYDVVTITDLVEAENALE